jgi:hypothetical protein
MYMGPQAVPKRQQPTTKLQCKISFNCTATEARNLAHMFSTDERGLAVVISWLWLPCWSGHAARSKTTVLLLLIWTSGHAVPS